jgi:hypothetical protein
VPHAARDKNKNHSVPSQRMSLISLKPMQSWSSAYHAMNRQLQDPVCTRMSRWKVSQAPLQPPSRLHGGQRSGTQDTARRRTPTSIRGESPCAFAEELQDAGKMLLK